MSKKVAKNKRVWTQKDETYRVWLVSGVRLPGKNQKGLAGVLGLSEPTVSKLLAGKRRLSLGEIDKIAAYFGPGHPPPNGEAPEPAPVRGGVVVESVNPPPSISVEAIIAPGFWGKMGVAVSPAVQRTHITGRLDPKYASIKQYACVLRDDPSHYVICAPFAAMRASPLPGDKVHVRRTRENGEQEDTIRVVHISAGRISLVLPDAADDDKDKSLAYPSRRSGETIELRGLVIGRFIAED